MQQVQSDAARTALEVAGRLLSRRPYTEAELRERLARRGLDEDLVEHTLARLGALDLVGDGSFAKQWVEERAERKGLGSRRLRAELERKGVAPDLIEEALQAEADSELARATALAAKRVSKVTHLPLPHQGGRLFTWLVGRGFEQEVAEAAARAVLPPEGWD